MSIDLSPAYFDLQLRFADALAQVSHLSFEEALLRYTNIYLQCIGRAFDPAHPAWQSYLEGLHQAADQAQWTFAFYESRREAPSASPSGCFQSTYLPDTQTIRLHFTNRDGSGYGPLSQARRPARLQELKALFAQVKQQQPEAKLVRGRSWLYNLDAYTRLFPPEYTSEMQSVDGEFQFLALWGQFLQRDGQIRPALTRAFLSACQGQRSLEGLLHCFPYQVLEPSCSVAEFHAFYESLAL
jgi:hypothetical protein